MKPKIIVENSSWCLCNAEMKTIINSMLSYKTTIWKKIGFRKKRITYTKYLIEKSKKDGNDIYFFHAGFVPKVITFLKEKGIDYDFESKVRTVEYDDPEVKDVDFRHYQKEQIEEALKNGRGVIKSPTGSGKSYTVMGIISAFSQEKILFLVDASEILKQLKVDILKVVSPFEVSDYRDKRGFKRIHVSTVQTFKNQVQKYKDYFDVVIIDEVDKVSSFTGMFAKVLTALNAPVKLGVTATIADDKPEAKLALEGLIGPVISEYSIHQAGKEKVLSKPVMHFEKSPKIPATQLLDSLELKKRSEEIFKQKVKKWQKKGSIGKKPYIIKPTRYQIVYTNGIVKNLQRNNTIATIAENIMYQGGSVLISVVKQEHGKILENMICGAKFIYGNTEDTERDLIKANFLNGKISCVIASNVWQRGISVSRINCFIKAEGGKSQTANIQWAGRALRMDKGNKTIEYEGQIVKSGQVLLVDFIDDNLHHYLKAHTKIRMDMYKSQGWI